MQNMTEGSTFSGSTAKSCNAVDFVDLKNLKSLDSPESTFEFIHIQCEHSALIFAHPSFFFPAWILNMFKLHS